MEQTQHRFTVLDSWRGICACMVALFHFHANNHFYNIPVFLNAGLFVDFFFVLSGFVIFINYHHKIRQGFGIGRFMLLRFGRLYPLHLAILLAFIAVEIAQVIVSPLSHLAETQPFQDVGSTPDYILSNVLMIHSFNVGERLSFNGPSWSISAEFYTYLVFALLIVLLKDRVLWGVVGVMALSLTFLLFYGEFMTTVNFGVVRCLYGFGAGALCALLWEKYNRFSQSKLLSPVVWNGIEIFTLLIALVFVATAKETIFVYLTPFVFFMTVYVFAYERGIVSTVLQNKIFVLLGTLSYSIYMVHTFVFGKIFNIGGRFIEKMTSFDVFIFIDDKERLGVEKWHGDLLSLSYIIIVIIGSYITYRTIEEPFRKYFRKLTYG